MMILKSTGLAVQTEKWSKSIGVANIERAGQEGVDSKGNKAN